MSPTTPTGPTHPSEGGDGGSGLGRPRDIQAVTPNERITQCGKYCEGLLKNSSFQEKAKAYKKGDITKDQLEREFLGIIQTNTTLQRDLGFADTASYHDFLSEIKCFENQLIHTIDRSPEIASQAQEELIKGCINTVQNEYAHDFTGDQIVALKKYLKKQTIDGLQLFLMRAKKRKKVLKEVFAEFDLNRLKINTLDFDSLHNAIVNISPLNPLHRKVQDAWSTLLGGIKIREGENIKEAFLRIQEDGTEGDLTADYEALFGYMREAGLTSAVDHIRHFLVRNYTPLVSYTDLAIIAPDYTDSLLRAVSPNTHKVPLGDARMDAEMTGYQTEHDLQKRYQSLLSRQIPVTSLPEEIQIRVLGEKSSAERLRQKNNFHQGKIGETVIPGVDYERSFEQMHQFHPDQVMTDTGLMNRLEELHPNRLKNPENFRPGAIMRWKYTDPQTKTPHIGYYQVLDTLGDREQDDQHNGEIRLRFIGNNQDGGRLSRAGIPLAPKTGPQCFEFIDHCLLSGEESEIDFIPDDGKFESTEWGETMKSDGVSMYTDAEARAELRRQYGEVDIPSREELDVEIDEILYGKGNALESQNADERKLRSGMTIALCSEDELSILQIEDIIEPTDGEPGQVTLWDGLPPREHEDHMKTLTFREFANVLKKTKKSYLKGVYRVPFGDKDHHGMNEKQFNALMKSKEHAYEGKEKRFSSITISEGKLGTYDANGNFHEQTVIKVGTDQDLYVSKIEGGMATVRQGTFKQTAWDKEKGVFTQQPSFSGTDTFEIPLSRLWSYMQVHSFDLDKEKTKPFQQEVKNKGGGSMSWWNIFKHAHSLGTVLHGDLWKGPWKAFEDQHHEDHAFAGKITAALAMEKAQGIPGVGGLLFDHDWANLMIGDANNSFQSYLDKLVEKIDGMGSYHRTRLIKKWSKLHFPDPKYMAAMFASMKIFGQLYPYDDGEDDVRHQMIHGHKVKEWFWYNTMMHSGACKAPAGWPEHMPPHGDDKWPEIAGEKVTEIQACYKIIDSFSHPLLKNLGRRYQKYMNNGHKEQIDGGKDNLEQRTTMEEKLDWMMGAVLGGKPTEALGAGTDLWLAEGYSREITTMPYAALIFGGREQQLLPKSQEYLKDSFQKGNHVPMFVFAQNKGLGDTFRKTGVVMAYTISKAAGDELKSLVDYVSKNRLHKGSKVENEEWGKKFQKFWRKNGAQLMDKLTGMRDPLLNFMMNDDQNEFNDIVNSLPDGDKKEHYKNLQKNERVIKAYYDRLQGTYDSPSHCEMNRGGPFYGGDNFRTRKVFDNGYPIFWMNWPDYLEQLDTSFLSGNGEKKGDGIFNEVRGFIDAIPETAEKIAADMGVPKDQIKIYAHRIAKSIYEKNVVKQIKPRMTGISDSPHAWYYNISAMLLGMGEVKKLGIGGTDGEDQTRYRGYFERMKEINKKAEELAIHDYPASIRYRTRQWKKWQEIVRNKISLADIDAAGESADSVSPGVSSSFDSEKLSSETLAKTEKILGDYHQLRTRKRPGSPEESLGQSGIGSGQSGDDDDTPPTPPRPHPTV